MGDAVLSAFLQVLFQSIAEFLKKELQSECHLDEERKSLISNVDMIQAILKGADKKTWLSESQKLLFASLKDASYHGMEVLDEYFYEVQRRQVIHFANLRNSRPYSDLNPLRMKFRHDMEKKIKDFARTIDCIKEIKEMHLAFQADAHGHGSQHYEGGGLDPTTLLPPTVVCGRDNDQEKIVGILFQPNLKSNDEVLPIVGDAYVGKTTVAQLVLNDERVSMHFELKLWVHVSHEFNIERITSSIVESIQGFPSHSYSLNTLQMRLEKLLRGRRYLLVLDDYWSENWEDWDKLKRSLYISGVGGGKIIVTTRSRQVARVLGNAPYVLQHLQEKDCWLLFCQCAQGTGSHVHNYGDNLDRRLKDEVLQKCKGVPFIAASLGYSIFQHQENDRSKWVDILRKEWDSSTSHFNKAHRLSYAQLDSHLKPCFAYSSIIPRKFQFEKEWLIQHWMAQDFIIPDKNRDSRETIEDTGRSYFRSLVNQSFFQRAHVGCSGEEHSYSFSEMMHNLASQVSGADCKCYMMGEPYNLPAKVRHLTVVFNKVASQDMFDVISCGEFLHTFIVLGGSEDLELKIPDDIGKRFTRLRTLDFSNFGVTNLPKSIGKLKHLRCLQLQGTKIKCLPRLICELYNLQTLGLRNCYDLEELPHELKNLRKLRHIDRAMTRDPWRNFCSLRSMPKDIGLLSDLQTLSRFVISKTSLGVYTHKGGIGELANLNNLRGKLLISNLHHVEGAQDAALANLASKQFLQKLELSWGNNNKKADEILENLKPPTKIKELTISGYTSMACPSWLGSAEYTNLLTVCLYDFKSCSVLPSLGMLPLLENLHLKGWQSLVSIACSRFCCRSMASFQSLKKLHLERMEILEIWDGEEKCAFPSLLELVIENCCKLEQVTHYLPSLAKLTVEGSPSFQGLWSFPSLKYLSVNASGEWILRSWPSLFSPISITLCKLPTVRLPSGLGLFHTSLQRLEISHCEQLQYIPEDWPPCNLTHFSVRYCPQLRELPWGIERLQALEDMEIVACEQITYLPEMIGLCSLIRLEISDCGSVQSLPNRGLPSSVQVVSINNCPLLARSCRNEGIADRGSILLWIDGHEVSAAAD